MPVCNKCGRFSNDLTVDVCEHCGAKNWFHDKIPKQSSAGRDSNDLACFGSLIGGLFVIALCLGGLWLLIFLVKWMWEHS